MQRWLFSSIPDLYLPMPVASFSVVTTKISPDIANCPWQPTHLQLKTTGLEILKQAGSQCNNVQTAERGHLPAFLASSLSLLYLQPFNSQLACYITTWHLLGLATLPGVLSTLSIMESHLLNEVLHDYPSSRLDVDLGTGFSELSGPFQHSVETCSTACCYAQLPSIPLKYSINDFVESTLFGHFYSG